MAAKTNALTRKVGPLPVYAWAAAGLVVAWFLFFRSPSSAAALSQQPVGATTASNGGGGSVAVPGSVSQDSGASDAGGSSDADLLSQILSAQQNTINTLTGAIIGGLPGGGSGEGATAAAAGGSSSSSSQVALDNGTAPSGVQQTGPASQPTISSSDQSPSGLQTPQTVIDSGSQTSTSTVDVNGVALSLTPGQFTQAVTTPAPAGAGTGGTPFKVS